MELTGERYGNLIVVMATGDKKDGRDVWLCHCDCGNTRIVTQGRLRRTKNGVTACKQCTKERAAANLIKHGDFGTRLYSIYHGILGRIKSPNNRNYYLYGKRGISICDSWEKSYLEFKKWALSAGYSDKLSIDRIDPDGDYCPDNCRWITPKQQSNNRRNNFLININGDTKTITEWADMVGISPAAIRSRLKKGFPPDMAVFKPYREATKQAMHQLGEGG